MKQAGNSKLQGTWVHRKVAIHLTQWISPIFAVQVTNWVGKHKDGDAKNNKSVILAGDGIFNCQLTLKDGKTVKIPMREDGYVNVTLLCKAAGKRIDNWNRLKNTKELFAELSNSLGFEGVRIKETVQGKNGGTYLHPDLGIQLAQWISPSFAIQVSRWTRELHDQLRKKRNYHQFKDYHFNIKMITKQNLKTIKEPCQDLPLSYDNKNVFKPEYNEIILHKLVVSKNSTIDIPVRKDGMVNATLLCKAGKKLFADYNRNKQTKAYLQALKSVMGIPITKLIIVKQAGNSKLQGTWVHRKVAIHLAQWISPIFAVQVTNWVDELLITGQVTLGQEKSNKELEDAFQKKIQSLQETVKTLSTENLQIKNTYSHLAELHDQLVKKRNYHKFKRGNCVYIVTDRWRERNYLKVGYTDNINARLRTYRTSMPDTKIEFLLYLDQHKLIEKCVKTRYEKKLVQKNHEYLIDTKVENLVKCIKSLVKYLQIETTEEEGLALYNEPYKTYNLVFVDQDGNVEDNTDPVEIESEDEKSEAEPESEPEPEVYNCKFCTKEYKHKGNLVRHLRKVHGEGKEEYDDGKTCKICNKVFRDRGKRNRHVRSVHEKSTKVKCTLCNKTYSTKDILNAHVKNVHEKKGKSECKLCGKTCSNPGNLRKHIRETHKRLSDVDCKICGKTFHNKTNLTQHIKNVHDRKEKSRCEICDKTLLTKSGLWHHMARMHKVVR